MNSNLNTRKGKELKLHMNNEPINSNSEYYNILILFFSFILLFEIENKISANVDTSSANILSCRGFGHRINCEFLNFSYRQ